MEWSGFAPSSTLRLHCFCFIISIIIPVRWKCGIKALPLVYIVYRVEARTLLLLLVGQWLYYCQKKRKSEVSPPAVSCSSLTLLAKKSFFQWTIKIACTTANCNYFSCRSNERGRKEPSSTKSTAAADEEEKKEEDLFAVAAALFPVDGGA